MRRHITLVLLSLVLAGCREPALLEGLDQDQANDVVALLQRNNIASSKVQAGKTGYNVSIREVDFAAAVDLLNLYALPAKPRVEVAQMFPADSLVASPRAEKARLLSALEQRLEQSLRTLAGVTTARVHVSYDVDAGEGGRRMSPTHLSALVVHEIDREPQLLISDVKRFLKNSFAEVEYDHISVVLSQRPAIQHARPSLAPVAASGHWLWLVGAVVLAGLAGAVVCWERQRRGKGARDATAG